MPLDDATLAAVEASQATGRTVCIDASTGSLVVAPVLLTDGADRYEPLRETPLQRAVRLILGPA